MKRFHLYAINVVLLLFSACSSDSDELPGGDTDTPSAALRIEVSASDFINSTNTRATDSGNATTFEDGDCIGITVLDKDSKIISANIPYKYNNGNWSFDSNNGEGKTALYYDNKAKTYLAYFPYSADANGVSSTDGLKAKFPPKSDQSSKDAYRASDLLVWSKTSDTPLKKLEIGFSHAYSSLSLSPSIKCKINGTETTYIPSGISDVSFTIGTEPLLPYQASDGSYRIVVSPKETGARWLCGYSDKMYSGTMSSTVLSVNTRYALVPALEDLGDYGLEKAQAGDFYCRTDNNDGTAATGYLIPSSGVSLLSQHKCVGLVFHAGKHTNDKSIYSELLVADGPCIPKDENGVPQVHGYAVALSDATGNSYCKWGVSGTVLGNYPTDADGSAINNYSNNGGDTDWSGYLYTKNMKTAAENNGGRLTSDTEAGYPAAWYALNYETTVSAPSNSSGWFLPAISQMWQVYQIRYSFSGIGGSNLRSNWYWSSSEDYRYSGVDALYVRVNYGNVNYISKSNGNLVRPVLAF